MWKPYEETRKYKADFRVKYKLYSQEEGGRKKPVFQGYRSDFFYDGDEIKDGIYAIHPEFEDEHGNIILDDINPVLLEGTALMWILFPEMRKEVHVKRIQNGVTGYFMEGSKKVAIAEVIEILDLHLNAKLLN
ncbi:hypothetical protein QFZ77_003270 [Paenibacillus sp. V4I3]|uniref:hypothetical protein n=1 Tax=unclassified Paenibacillus TaxID=185978 RepID=UPI0027856920|nr:MULTISPECIES: hypothetical protein [unclassified Paenibacillus]MDQ0874611.1 hypothetical protein [Paenibacillus sp. V4I3]MDQ0889637.1 hypothetical protein [Paenibacillus sp. V4I9]